jgi:protoheme IX farnesyltransferase
MKAGTYTTAGLGRSGTRLFDYLELTKPDVTFLVVISTLAGFYLGSGGALDWILLVHALVGTTLVSAGTAAFNHYLERDDDARMRRTARRPLPAGRIQPGAAFGFATLLSVGGVLYLLVLVNWLASLLAFSTWASYLFLYTPLKKRTLLCTAIGAFPGAMPPLIGWAAASGSLATEAWILYAILFLWQFPHFLSIAWIYREDYARGGFMMLPAVDTTGHATGRQMVFYSWALFPVALLPGILGMAGLLYLLVAVVLGSVFVWSATRVAMMPSNSNARRLLQMTIFYLPLLFAFLMLDKR